MDYYGVSGVRAHGEKFLDYEHYTQEPLPHPVFPEGKSLMAIRRDRSVEVCCDVTEPGRWHQLRKAYEEVAFSTVEFWLIDTNKLALCPNEGRV